MIRRILDFGLDKESQLPWVEYLKVTLIYLNIFGTTPASEPQNDTVENLTKLNVTGLFFVVLRILLFKSWQNQKGHYVEPFCEHKR